MSNSFQFAHDHSQFDDDDNELQNDLDECVDNTRTHDAFALNSDEKLHLHLSSSQNMYSIRQGGAVNESQKEFEIFSVYAGLGSGRSYNYLSALFNLQENRIAQIAKKNNWGARVSEYDRHELTKKLELEKDARAIEHKRKLEEYRSQQEFLGRVLSHDAAKLAQLASRTLDEHLQSDRNLDMRDIPSILNSAAKIAEVGKNLQSGALGVEQLLVALEEADFDE